MKNGLRIAPSGNKYWYVEGKFHREDGHAVEYPNGTKEWCLEGKRHRVDGPAIEYPNGNKHWWLNGISLPCKSQEEFNKLLKLKAFW